MVLRFLAKFRQFYLKRGHGREWLTSRSSMPLSLSWMWWYSPRKRRPENQDFKAISYLVNSGPVGAIPCLKTYNKMTLSLLVCRAIEMGLPNTSFARSRCCINEWQRVWLFLLLFQAESGAPVEGVSHLQKRWEGQVIGMVGGWHCTPISTWA